MIAEKIILDQSASFRVKLERKKYFDVPWHNHPEFEVFYIEEGEGEFFTGDRNGTFTAGDLFMLGSGLPHTFKCNHPFYDDPTLFTVAHVVHFNFDCFGQRFFTLPEFSNIHKFLESAGIGFKIKVETGSELYHLIRQLHFQDPTLRFVYFIQLLHHLSVLPGKEPLASLAYIQEPVAGKLDRMQLVYQYINQHFREDIKLEKLAGIMSMSVPAFCRLYKSRTLKSAIIQVNELRIGYAKKLFQEGRKDIIQVGYECGFNSPSYFIKKFRETTGRTPKSFLAK